MEIHVEGYPCLMNVGFCEGDEEGQTSLLDFVRSNSGLIYLDDIEITRYLCFMNIDEILKVLANPVRVRILSWLKDPDAHFPPMLHLPEEEQGKGYVCVGVIQEKAGVTQSTVSHYLNMMKQAELLSCQRIGQWTYYRRNDETLRKTADYIANL